MNVLKSENYSVATSLGLVELLNECSKVKSTAAYIHTTFTLFFDLINEATVKIYKGQKQHLALNE